MSDKMSFTVRTDCHVHDKAPQSRVDDYLQTCLNSLRQIGEHAERTNAIAVLDNGDFFHAKAATKNSHLMVREVIDLHRSHYPCPVYCNPGNHDFPFNNIEYLDRQPLGVLFAAGIFERMYDHTFERGDLKVRVVGFPYKRVFTEEEFDLERGEEDVLIVCAHTFASPKGGELFGTERALSYYDLSEASPDIFCFLPDTKVLDAQGRVLSIQNLTDATSLMGREGVGHPVEIEQVHPVREISEHIFELDVEGLPPSLMTGATSKHPFWATPNMFCRLLSRNTRRCHPGKIRTSYPCTTCKSPAVSDPQWIEAKDLKEGDYVSVPVPNIPEDSNHDPEKARLLGYYLAEGHLLRNRKGVPVAGVGFTFHENETSYHEDVSRLMFKYFGLEPHFYSQPDSKALQIRFHGEDSALFFRGQGSSLAHQKELGPWVWTLDVESRLELLNGWLRGDGHARPVQNGKRVRASVMGATVSENLATQLYLLSLSCGLDPSYSIRPEKEVTFPQGHTSKGRECHILTFTGDSAYTMASRLEVTLGKTSKNRVSGYFEGGLYWCRIKTIRKRYYEGPVYNIRTSTEEYVAGLMLTHNCFGHWHIDQGIQTINGKHFMNLGSMTRGSLVQDNLTRIPRFGQIQIEKTQTGDLIVELEAVELDVPPASEVFDLERHERLKEETRDIETFIESLLLQGEDDSEDLLSEIQGLTNFKDEVRQAALSYLQEAMSDN
jgi:hypothetical protein